MTQQSRDHPTAALTLQETPHCWPTQDSAFNHSLLNVPSTSDPFPNKHLLLKLVFYQEEGYFQTNEDIQIRAGERQGGEEEKKYLTNNTEYSSPEENQPSS